MKPRCGQCGLHIVGAHQCSPLVPADHRPPDPIPGVGNVGRPASVFTEYESEFEKIAREQEKREHPLLLVERFHAQTGFLSNDAAVAHLAQGRIVTSPLERIAEALERIAAALEPEKQVVVKEEHQPPRPVFLAGFLADRIRIEGDGTPRGTKLYLDGEFIRGVQEFQWIESTHQLPTLKLTLRGTPDVRISPATGGESC